MIKLVECPRDAMQGIPRFIPTRDKIEYLNLLLNIGFDTLDFGSFVSPKTIPQMQDTKDIVKKLDLSSSKTKLLAITANLRGAREASEFDEIFSIGFPFSISETFQQRNTNSSIGSSLGTVEQIISICDKQNKEAVIYLSMGFGNPYGDEWNMEIVEKYTGELVARGVKTISLADTTGVSSPVQITNVLSFLTAKFAQIEFGVHLHSKAGEWLDKIDAAYKSGCRRFDSALKGYGGCPMTQDLLTGNIATENIINYFEDKGENLNLNKEALKQALTFSARIFL